MSFALSLAQVVFANLFDFPGAALALPPSQVADSSASASSHLHLPGLGSSSSPSSGAASNSKRPRHPSGVLRRQFIARCRELRADVRRFEESFESKHGRTPTSTSDRAPLAATYFEYKRLKVHVRGVCRPSRSYLIAFFGETRWGQCSMCSVVRLLALANRPRKANASSEASPRHPGSAQTNDVYLTLWTRRASCRSATSGPRLLLNPFI